jgi:ribosome-binding factor A
MSGRRLDRINELMRREISTIIQRDFEFPDSIVNVCDVEITQDLKEGKVWVGVVGKLHPDRVISMLNAKRGMIQTAVAKRVVLRSTPRLVFKLDTSAQRGVDMVNLLDDIEKNLPKAKPLEDEDSEI